MIIDDLENFGKYVKLNKNFEKIAVFLAENDLKKLEKGSYEIDGRDIYVNIDEYETKETSLPEAHRAYADIQIVLEGNEKIGYSDIKNGVTAIEYNKEKDIEFLNAECEFLKAYSGRFFVFFPQDIHQPCITDGLKSQVKKAVFKIKL